MSFGRSKLSLAVLLIGLVQYSAQAQRTPAGTAPKKAPTAPVQSHPAPATWTEWETMTPEGEEFTVSMPKGTKSESAPFPYHKMELKARLYLSSIPSGPVVAIASFSGIKSDPSQYSDFSRFNSYIDAFKDFFPAKVRTKETIPRLTLINSKPYNGHTGRSYKMVLGDLSGTLHAYTTRKRFYAIVSLNTKKDDALEEKFLSSFVLPERQPDTPKTTAANEGEQVNGENGEGSGDGSGQTNEGREGRKPVRAGVGVAGTVGVPVGDQDNTEAGVVRSTTNVQTMQTDQPGQPAQSQPQEKQKRGPVNGGVLNNRAIYLPIPESPNREISGVVMVQVMVDEQGSVIEARALSGPPALQALAVNAARLARFSQTLLMGEPVRVTGTLTYSFPRAN